MAFLVGRLRLEHLETSYYRQHHHVLTFSTAVPSPECDGDDGAVAVEAGRIPPYFAVPETPGHRPLALDSYPAPRVAAPSSSLTSVAGLECRMLDADRL